MMTAEQFFKAYDAEHPLQKGCTIGQWIDGMAAAQRAYAEYDPEASAKLVMGMDFGIEPGCLRLTMDEWIRRSVEGAA